MLEATDDEPDEEMESMEEAVEDRRGLGMAGSAFPMSIVWRVLGTGRAGTGGAGAAAASFESLELRPTIHHSPEGLLSTLIASVFWVSMSPEPIAQHRARSASLLISGR